MKNTTAQAMEALQKYLEVDPEELAEIIHDATEGALFADWQTSKLLQELFNTMVHPDNLNLAQIACAIEDAGSPEIAEVLVDLADGATILHTKKQHQTLCPGYGEDCGGARMEGSDLCPDCHMARCDAESPRIPR